MKIQEVKMVQLQKNSKVSLKKEDNTLKILEVGLGWNTRTDLDSIAYLFDSTGKVKKTIYFANEEYTGIFLSGDNVTGGGKGDNEIITVMLDLLPSWVTKVSFCANIFAAGLKLWGIKDFSKVNGAYIRVVNSESKKEICRYNLQENGKGFNAFYFANMLRRENDWEFIAVGQGLNGSITQIQSQIENKI